MKYYINRGADGLFYVWVEGSDGRAFDWTFAYKTERQAERSVRKGWIRVAGPVADVDCVEVSS